VERNDLAGNYARPVLRSICARSFPERSIRKNRHANDADQSISDSGSFVIHNLCWYKLIRFGWQGDEVERSRRLPLLREQVALVVLSLARGGTFTPVQIQKALFLASRKVSGAFNSDSRYDFQPYDFGPFDWQVYSDVEGLERRGLARINQPQETRWRTYAATEAGVAEGLRLAQRLTEEQRTILDRIANLVRRLTFNDLVSAIYRAYPEMKERSVFRD
jgi:uncharacterized protein